MLTLLTSSSTVRNLHRFEHHIVFLSLCDVWTAAGSVNRGLNMQLCISQFMPWKTIGDHGTILRLLQPNSSSEFCTHMVAQRFAVVFIGYSGTSQTSVGRYFRFRARPGLGVFALCNSKVTVCQSLALFSILLASQIAVFLLCGTKKDVGTKFNKMLLKGKS